MELQELENIWNEYDKRIDDRVKVNYQFLKKISVDKTQSLLFPGKLSAVLEAIINFLFLSLILSFAINNPWNLKYSLPAFALTLIILATIAWNIYGFILLTTINYRSPVITIQRRLENYKFQNLYRQQQLLYIIYPLSQTLFMIIFCKGMLNLNIYNHPVFLIVQFIASICIIPFVIWIVKITPDKKMEAALHFLNDLKRFEKEE